jgi:zona occludens toxin
MINGLEGIPGSGKSYEAVVYHVLHYVKKGRKVITNLPLDLDAFAAIDPAYLDLIELRIKPMPILGTWDADRTPAFLIEEVAPLALENSPYSVDFPRVRFTGKSKLFGSPWDFYSDWKGKEGEGPVFIIDECHVGMPKTGTNSEVIEYFKLHRHFNVDILLCTQNFRDVCGEISGLLAMLIKVRKADILGKKGVYIRKVHGGYRGAVVSTEERPYHAQFFSLYKSHTQGNSVSESSAVDVTPFLLKWRRMSWWVIFAGVAIMVVVIGNKTTSKPATMSKTATITPSITESQTASLAAPAALPVESKTVEIPEPYENKSFHLTGRATMGEKVIYMFSVSQNGYPVSAVTHKDLERVGYKWLGLTDCAGTLFWQQKAIPVTCDVPQVSMSVASASTTGPQASSP